jgi:hypothetical protein
VLRPLAAKSVLADRIFTGRRVVSVSRTRMTKMDMPNHPVRGERLFRLLVERTDRTEEAIEADVVLDASGVYDTAQNIGTGGAPALGERFVFKNLIRHLGVLSHRLPELGDRRVLLVGHGHSAANALDFFAQKKDVAVVWAVRSPNARPVVEVACDPLPQRKLIVEQANAFAESPPSWLSIERRAHVESIVDRTSGIEVKLAGGRGGTFDAVVALTGYRPDLSFLSELQLEVSPVSEGSAGLHRALANVTDCLNTPKLAAKDLGSGEPGFHLIGIKSYGRMPAFLLQTGFSQLETILELLKG